MAMPRVFWLCEAAAAAAVEDIERGADGDDVLFCCEAVLEVADAVELAVVDCCVVVDDAGWVECLEGWIEGGCCCRNELKKEERKYCRCEGMAD